MKRYARIAVFFLLCLPCCAYTGSEFSSQVFETI